MFELSQTTPTKSAHGKKVASYRSMLGHRFLYPCSLIFTFFMIRYDPTPYWIGMTLCGHFTFILYMLAIEAIRVSRTTFYTNGVKRSSWFRSKFYAWASLSKVVYATNYLGGSNHERMHADRIKGAYDGLFFIDAQDKPLFVMRNPQVWRLSEKIQHIPESVKVEKIDERVTFWTHIWHDISPESEYPSVWRGIWKTSLYCLVAIWVLPNAIIWHYLNEWLFHFPA